MATTDQAATSGQRRVVLSAWLAAMIEGEGYVSPPGQAQTRVTITNQNVHLLAKVERALATIGVVRFGGRFDRRDKTVSIAVYGKDNFYRLHKACGPHMVTQKGDYLALLAEGNPRQDSRTGGDANVRVNSN